MVPKGLFGSFRRLAIWRVGLALAAKAPIRRFNQFSKVVFQPTTKLKTDSQVLVELNSLYFSYPGYLYLTKVLQEKHASKVVAYSAYGSQNALSSFSFGLRSRFAGGKFSFFRALGARKFVKPKFFGDRALQITSQARSLLHDVHTKTDFARLTWRDVQIGDLIYGAYIARYREPTLILQDRRLHKIVWEFLYLFDFWERYFERNSVRSLVTSHLVYEMGLPARIALKLGVPCYLMADRGAQLNRIDPSNPFYGSEAAGFLRDFEKLPISVQTRARKLALERLSLRFSGVADFDLNLSASQRFEGASEVFVENVVKRASRSRVETHRPVTVLIAAHVYWDSPHSRGESLFPDFYEWLIFLGELSEETEYRWLLKVHPDEGLESKRLYGDLKTRYPRLEILPAEISHRDVIDIGVDAVLTVHGTVALDYSLLGLTVVNASPVNPHRAFSFSLSPATVSEYADVIRNIEGLVHVPNLEEILSFYFMKAIFYSPNIFYRDFVGAVWGKMPRNSPRALDVFIDESSSEKHDHLMLALRRFVDSGDERLCWKHFGLLCPDLNIYS